MIDERRRSRFLDAIRTVRDECEKRAADGYPVTVNDPGTEHGRRLLKALGADCTVEMTLDEYLELLNG